MTSVYGSIIEVETVNVGEPLAAAAALSATTITVADAATFDEFGGQLALNGEVYVYTAIDATLNTITLLTGLVAAAEIDDRVEIRPAAPVKKALIDLDTTEGESVWVTVPHNLVTILDDGMREESSRETALLEERGLGILYLADIIASQPRVEPKGLLARIVSTSPLVVASTAATLVPGAFGTLLFDASVDYEYTLSADISRTDALNNPCRLGVQFDGSFISGTMGLVTSQSTNVDRPTRLTMSVSDTFTQSEGSHLVEVVAFHDSGTTTSWTVNSVRLILKRL